MFTSPSSIRSLLTCIHPLPPNEPRRNIQSLPSKVRLDPRLPSPIVTRYSEKKLSTKPKAEEISLRSILSSRSILSIFRNYFLLSVCGTSFDVVFILLAYTPVHLGGLSRSVSVHSLFSIPPDFFTFLHYASHIVY